MPVDTSIAIGREPLSARARNSRAGNWFFTGVAIAAAVSVLTGFARSYYLKAVFPIPSFPLLFHVHGAVFTAWMLLLVLQAWLVATRRTALHRRIGWVGLCLAVLVLVTGSWVSVAAARGQGPISAAVARGKIEMAGR